MLLGLAMTLIKGMFSLVQVVSRIELSINQVEMTKSGF